MGRRDREKRGEGREKRSKGRKGDLQQQLELVSSLVEEIRTVDSEIDLLKQKTNAIIRQINVLKNAILVEKKEIKNLEAEEELDKSRFESIITLVKELKGKEQ